ncbi:MAG: TIGR01777 family oxidoreductase [Candidatus Obscuribacterales bacterium]|nr:TIGR01777 family oxidoreductase [Candidatus Obscuribacterales bacterium]
MGDDQPWGHDRFIYESEIAGTAHDVIAWHKRPGAFERLAPPWMDVKVLERKGGIDDGGTVVLALKKGPITLKWHLAHRDFIEDRQFCDYQLSGPFASWQQVHRVEDSNGDRARLVDSVTYQPPLPPFGEIGAPVVDHELKRLFRFRHRLLQNDLHLLSKNKSVRPLKFLIAGSSGLIGTNLIPFLLTQGHSVTRLVRPDSSSSPVVLDGSGQPEATIVWSPSGEAFEASFEGFDVFINLSGESVADGLWTEDKKKELRESRLQTTRKLSLIINKLKNPPSVFLCASAIGYYGNTGNQIVSESASCGLGFLAQLCKEWEDACNVSDKKKTRVCNLRIGIVLTPKGGALKKMLPVFQMGLGGKLGSGQQFMSWISIEDVITAIYHCALTESLSGAVNLVAPKAINNSEFTRTLSSVLKRPALVAVPELALKTAFKEMADECLLSGNRVLPEKLMQSQFEFREPVLEYSLNNLLGLG